MLQRLFHTETRNYDAFPLLEDVVETIRRHALQPLFDAAV